MNSKKLFLLKIGICVVIVVAISIFFIALFLNKKQEAYETFYEYAQVNFDQPIDLNVYYSFLTGEYQAEYRNSETNTTYILWFNSDNEVCHRIP